MIAAICGLKAGEFVHTLGDAHLYANHFEQARAQLGQAGRELVQNDWHRDAHRQAYEQIHPLSAHKWQRSYALTAHRKQY